MANNKFKGVTQPPKKSSMASYASPSFAKASEEVKELLSPNADQGSQGEKKIFWEDLDPEKIVPNPKNDHAAGDTEEQIEAFATSLGRNNMLHNLVVSRRPNGEDMLLSGERRWRAILLNKKKEPNNPQWQTVHCQIRTGLSDREEMILLDAANVEDRAFSQMDETKQRKATMRLVKNMMEEFDVSQEDAVKLLKGNMRGKEKTIDRNVKLETSLIPELKVHFDNDRFNKKQAMQYVTATPQDQKLIAESYDWLADEEKAVIAEYSEKVTSAIKTNAPVPRVEKREAQNPVQKESEAVKKQAEKIKASVGALAKKRDFIKTMQSGTGNELRTVLVEAKKELDELVESLGE